MLGYFDLAQPEWFKSLREPADVDIEKGSACKKCGNALEKDDLHKCKSVKKSADAVGGEQSFDELSSQIREAFNTQRRNMGGDSPPQLATSSYQDWHVEKVFPTFIICQNGYGSSNKYQKIPYKMGKDGVVTFGKPQNVKLSFQICKAQISKVKIKKLRKSIRDVIEKTMG